MQQKDAFDVICCVSFNLSKRYDKKKGQYQISEAGFMHPDVTRRALSFGLFSNLRKQPMWCLLIRTVYASGIPV